MNSAAREHRWQHLWQDSPVRSSLSLLTAMLIAVIPSVTRAAPPAVGRPAPPLIVRQLDGHPFDLAKLRGKVVLINIWATWCSPCRIEMPTLNAFYRRYHARGLDLLGLSIDDAPDAARVAQVMRQFSYPGALASAARVDGFGEPVAVPVTYVIDTHGIIRAQLQAEGPSGVSRRLLEQTVLPLLAPSGNK
jgi:cytochrome c biogenesis protein CcmG, thiol:disulfide interchange protein DsbE